MSSELRAIARQVVADDTSEDLRVMAKTFADAVDEYDAHEVIEELAVQFLRDFIGEERRTAETRAQKGHVSKPQPSWRWAKAGAYREFLNQRENLDGRSVPIGDMGIDDLRLAVAARRTQARGHMDRANRYKKLIAVMEEKGATKVGDLDQADLMGALS